MMRARQRGALLIASILLIVLTGVIGAQAMRSASLERAGASLAVMQVRARYALESGIAWADRYVRAHGSCFESPLAMSVDGDGHGRFELEFDCRAETSTGGQLEVQVFVASGTRTSTDYVQATRSVSLSAERARPPETTTNLLGY